MSSAPMELADWIVCAIAAAVMVAATAWTLYASPDRQHGKREHSRYWNDNTRSNR